MPEEQVLANDDFTVQTIGERQNGWTPLVWSFGAAASITVSNE